MNLRQEKYQDIQDFREQYMAIHKVYTKLGLRFRRCKSDVKAVLLKEGVTTPSDEQLEEALDCVEEEHHAIVFLYKFNKHRYWKLIEDM